MDLENYEIINKNDVQYLILDLNWDTFKSDILSIFTENYFESLAMGEMPIVFEYEEKVALIIADGGFYIPSIVSYSNIVKEENKISFTILGRTEYNSEFTLHNDSMVVNDITLVYENNSWKIDSNLRDIISHDENFEMKYINPLIQSGLITAEWETTSVLNSNQLLSFYLLNYIYPNLNDIALNYELSENEAFVYIPAEDVLAELENSFFDIGKEQLILDNENYNKETDKIAFAIGGIGSSPIENVKYFKYEFQENEMKITVETQSPFDNSFSTINIFLQKEENSENFKFVSCVK